MNGSPEELPRGVGQEDRRRSPRTMVEVTCQAVADFDFVLLGERIVELSTSGLLLRADGIPAEVGECVILSFRPPGSAEWIDAEARIVRLITGSRPGAPGFGLELMGLTPFEQGLLEGALERAREHQCRRRASTVRTPRKPRMGAVRRRQVIPVGAVPTVPTPMSRGAVTGRRIVVLS